VNGYNDKKKNVSHFPTALIIEQVGLAGPLALLKQEEITPLRERARERTIPA